MDINSLPGNSNASKEEKEERKVIQPVAKGEVKKPKQSFGKRFASLFLAENVDNLKEYLIFDILIPAAKDTMLDLITKGAEMLFNGKVRSGRKNTSATNGKYVSYSTYSYKSPPEDTRVDVPRREVPWRVDPYDICFPTRSQATDVLTTLEEILEHIDPYLGYYAVTVADFFEAAGVSGNGYPDQNYGWTNLSGAYITGAGDEYRIVLPKPIQLIRK